MGDLCRVQLSHTVTIEHEPQAVFGMVTPEGERAWVPGWAPHYPAGKSESAATVFRTHHGGEETTWVIVEIDRESLQARYCRCSVDRAALVEVRCVGCGEGTALTVTYDVTALSEAGNAKVTTFASAFVGEIDSWRSAIGEALTVTPS